MRALTGRHGLFYGAAILLLGIVLGGAVMLASGNGGEAEAQSTEQERTVTASGAGQVSVPPDMAIATIGVEISNESADAALTEANEQVEAITAALVGLGIAEDDITTASFSIWPEYRYPNESESQAELSGFHVSHMLSVEIHDIDLAGDVVATAVDAGANAVHGMAFTVEDPQSALDRARERALENARHKGEELARLVGGTLGPVVTISETSFTPVPVERQAGAGDDAVAESSVPFNPGESTFTVDLQVTWALN